MSTSMRHAVVRKALMRLECALHAMGIAHSSQPSWTTASHYVVVELGGGDVATIRVSDHAARKSSVDYDVWCDRRAAAVYGDGAWSHAVAWIGDLTGKALPEDVVRSIARLRTSGAPPALIGPSRDLVRLTRQARAEEEQERSRTGRGKRGRARPARHQRVAWP